MQTHPDLAGRQELALRTYGSLFLSGAAVMLGFCAALILVFALDRISPGLAWVFVAAGALMLIGMIAGLVVLKRDSAQFQEELEETLRITPNRDTTVTIPAVLSRTVPARSASAAHQLVYSAHWNHRVTPVAVALPAGQALPQEGSGAWLQLDPARPDIAWIAPLANPEEHVTALQDRSLSNLTSRQKGLTLPPRAYLIPAFIGAGVFALAFVAFAAVLLAVTHP